jgi:hypothetical protein
MKIDATKLLGFRIAGQDNHSDDTDGKAVRLSAKVGDKTIRLGAKVGGKPDNLAVRGE